ncbi:MAG: hypothetical protein PWP08_504 [Methanofollis sp.]|nr:hypothetical protein [Methanofollis sp.]
MSDQSDTGQYLSVSDVDGIMFCIEDGVNAMQYGKCFYIFIINI